MAAWGFGVTLLDNFLIPFLTLVFAFLWIRDYWRFKDFPPGPRGWPIVGSLFQLGPNVHEALTGLSKKYGTVFSVKLGSQRVVVLNDYESVRQAFIDEGNVFSGRPSQFLFEYQMQQRDIVTTEGPIWREKRKFMLQNMKSFGFGKSSSEELIKDSIQMVIEDLDASQGAPIDFQYLFFLPVLNVIWKYSANHPLPKNSAVSKSLCKLVRAVGDGFANQALNFLPFLRFIPGDLFGFWKHNRSHNRMWKFLLDEVESHQRSFLPGQHRDFIDIHLQEMMDRKGSSDEGQPPYNVEHLVGTLYDLFTAGSDTTSGTLLWAFLLLAIHPEAQCKVQKEIDDVIGRGRQPCFSDVPKLPYLEATINEVHRFCSLVPLSLPHSPMRDVVFRGYRIPHGTTIIQNIHAIHRDAKYWIDPEQFRPERFLDENNRVLKPPYLMPFSVGPRSCPGEPMARMELHQFLGILLQKYNFSLPPGSTAPSLEPVVGITLVPRPYALSVTSR